MISRMVLSLLRSFLDSVDCMELELSVSDSATVLLYFIIIVGVIKKSDAITRSSGSPTYVKVLGSQILQEYCCLSPRRRSNFSITELTLTLSYEGSMVSSMLNELQLVQLSNTNVRDGVLQLYFGSICPIIFFIFQLCSADIRPGLLTKTETFTVNTVLGWFQWDWGLKTGFMIQIISIKRSNTGFLNLLWDLMTIVIIKQASLASLITKIVPFVAQTQKNFIWLQKIKQPKKSHSESYWSHCSDFKTLNMIIVQTSKNLIGKDYTAYLMNLIANSLWALGLLYGTECKSINYVYMGLIRGLGTILLAVPIAKLYNIRIDFPSLSDLKILNLRNLIMAAHGFFFALSFHYLQAPIVYTISNAGPIVVYVIDYFMHNVQVTRRQLIGMVVAFAGIILTINSHLIYRELGFQEKTQSDFEYQKVSLEIKMLVAMLFFLSVVCWAYGVVITKKLKSTTTLQVSVHQGLTMLLVNSVAIFIVPNPAELTFSEQIYIFLKVGLLLAFSSGLYIASLFVTEKSGNVTIVGFSTVFIGYLVSMLRYRETPNIFGVIGSICIGTGLVCVLLR